MRNDSSKIRKPSPVYSSKETDYLLSGANGLMLRKSILELENGYGIEEQISGD
ncbi:MAG: hypothetical protein WBG46_04810 [Nonlabens sp.]